MRASKERGSPETEAGGRSDTLPNLFAQLHEKQLRPAGEATQAIRATARNEGESFEGARLTRDEGRRPQRHLPKSFRATARKAAKAEGRSDTLVSDE